MRYCYYDLFRNKNARRTFLCDLDALADCAKKHGYIASHRDLLRFKKRLLDEWAEFDALAAEADHSAAAA